MASDYIYTADVMEQALIDAEDACRINRDNGAGDRSVSAALSDIGADGEGICNWVVANMAGLPPELSAVMLAGIHIGLQAGTNVALAAQEMEDKFRG